MPNLLSETRRVPKDRIVTIICLIMIIEHQELSLEELIRTTGMTFNECRSATQNLVNVKLITVHPTNKGIPVFKLKDEEAAKEFIEFANQFT